MGRAFPVENYPGGTAEILYFRKAMKPTSAAAYWEQPIAYLKGVGPQRAQALTEAVGIRTFADLLYYFPFRYSDRSQATPLAELYGPAAPQGQVTVVGILEGFKEQGRGRKRWLTATLTDGTAHAQLKWFRGLRYVAQRFQPGMKVRVYGKPSFYRRVLQFTHPEMEPHQEQAAGAPAPILPVYPTTERLKNMHLDTRGFRKLLRTLLEEGTPYIEENLPPDILEFHRLLPRARALQNIHFPETMRAAGEATQRLKFEELFFFELLLATRRLAEQPQRNSPVFTKIGDYFNRFYHHQLPFQLTGAQKRVLRELRKDVNQPYQMNRLVQGDVGSGKTIVALMTMLIAIDNGYQAAMMAPTEILAEQHFFSLQEWVTPLGLNVDLLTGSQRSAKRKQVLTDLLNGHTHIVVGTHALIEDNVRFQRLGLTVIDEQHKFGVLQRSKLWHKHTGWYPHNLAMTATPIPRTLAMTTYGDIDVSVIDELPPGRKPVRTAIRTEKERLRVFGFVGEELKKGRQAYFVYPLVEENEELDLIAVTEGYEALQKHFKAFRVGIVHGQMRPEDKEKEMRRFKDGQTQLLVSTTVIEVGVDVPNATVMVIENANRFGLSQLHQLRGRVGRGGEQSYCILMAPKDLNDKARTRLKAMTETNDGFRISEVDLQLRGPGDFLGTRQSGLPEFKLANIVEDQGLLRTARDAAFQRIAADPNLSNPANALLKQELERFVAYHQLDALLA